MPFTHKGRQEPKNHIVNYRPNVREVKEEIIVAPASSGVEVLNTNESKKKKQPAPQPNITMKIEEQTKKRNNKYSTDEERKEAIKQQKRESAKRIRDAKKEGKGIFTSLTKTAKNAIKSVSNFGKKTIGKIEKYGDAVIYGRNDYPPKIRNILDKYGNKIIRGITIGRTPVPQLLTGALSVASGGTFGKNYKNSPYDTLFHLFIRLILDDGSVISMEKNEVINMDIDPAIPPNTETIVVGNVPENLTPLTILDNAKKIMGSSFFSYSARDNNCQDFILALFNGSHIRNEQDRNFIKQDTKSLFEGLTGLRKFSNTITDIGGRFNVLTQGAGIESDYDSDSDSSSDKEYHNKKYNGKNIISNNNIMPKFAKGSQEAKDHMAKIREMRGSGIPDDRFFHTEEKSHIKGGAGNSSKALTRKMGLRPRHLIKGSAEAKAYMSSIRSNKGKKVEGSGLYAGGSGGSVIDDAIEQSKHLIGFGVPNPSVLGFGVHHHHYYTMEGNGMFDWANPKKNGVAKAFDPQQNGVAKAFEPVKDIAEKTFTPQLGKDITSGLIHQALPSVVSGLAGSATTLATGNPYAGFAVGQTLGKYAGKKAGDAVGNATGYGLIKGSQEAKDKMAKLRAMRGKK